MRSSATIGYTWALAAAVAVSLAGCTSSDKPPASTARGASGAKQQVHSQLEGFGKPVHIMFAFDRGAAAAGLNEMAFENELMAVLKRDKIEVQTDVGIPMLWINMSANEIENDKTGVYYSFVVELQAKEPVRSLQREKNRDLIASVWERNAHGVLKKGDRRIVEEYAKALIEAFHRDYSASEK